MVRLTRSFGWEEFRHDFLYVWIETLHILDKTYDTAGSNQLLWMLAAFATAMILFVIACSLMLMSYRRIDPRYPKIEPQPLTFRELFFDLEPIVHKGPFKSRIRLFDETSRVRTLKSSSQAPRTAQEPEFTDNEKSLAVPIVASSTPIVKSAIRKSTEVVVASSTPIVTDRKTKTESTVQASQGSSLVPGSLEHIPEKSALREKSEERRAIKSSAVGKTQISSRGVLWDQPKERPKSLMVQPTILSEKVAKDRSKLVSPENITPSNSEPETPATRGSGTTGTATRTTTMTRTRTRTSATVSDREARRRKSRLF
ncbi:unnamed protein product [Haemonchus placei]|uniref:Neur_chan_memb domain-containing protein n=1 Tax=Haemonchus placei TaxID=6290 RepID=A0A0N4WS46_HAEPC|nr:unnamed protein product [Haemonchus placei]